MLEIVFGGNAGICFGGNTGISDGASTGIFFWWKCCVLECVLVEMVPSAFLLVEMLEPVSVVEILEPILWRYWNLCGRNTGTCLVDIIKW